MKFLSTERKLSFDNVLIVPQKTRVSSRQEVNLNIKYSFPEIDQEIYGKGIIVSNMDTVGTIATAMALSKHQMFVSLHKYYSADRLINFFNKPESEFSFYTLGIKNDDLNKFDYVYRQTKNINKVCIDVACGYMQKFLDFVSAFREQYPKAIIMAGNVCTPEGTEDLIKAGANVIKVGISNGNFCETRQKAGVGYLQISAIIECTEVTKKYNCYLCSDGGCKSPADICKAFATGADFVMSGTLFAGHDECEGEWITEREKIWNDNPKPGEGVCKITDNEVKKYLKFYGMSSKTANNKYNGGLAEYRTSEGKEDLVAYKGPVANIVQDICGSLASCCSYSNVFNLSDLHKNAQFIRV